MRVVNWFCQQIALMLLLCVQVNAQEFVFGIGITVFDMKDPAHGIIVADIEPNSPAAKYLKVGDIIQKINGLPRGSKSLDTDVAAGLIESVGSEWGAGAYVSVLFDRVLDRPFGGGRRYQANIPIAYHAGTHDYDSSDALLRSLVAGAFSGGTLGFGPESFCLLYYFTISNGNEYDMDIFMDTCFKEMRREFELLKENNQLAYYAGRGIVSAMLDIPKNNKGRSVIFGDNPLGRCPDIVALNAARKTLTDLNEIGRKEKSSEELASKIRNKVVAGLLECLIKR